MRNMQIFSNQKFFSKIAAKPAFATAYRSKGAVFLKWSPLSGACFRSLRHAVQTGCFQVILENYQVSMKIILAENRNRITFAPVFETWTAGMAELVDAYVSGAYARKGVGVRLPLPAQSSKGVKHLLLDSFFCA